MTPRDIINRLRELPSYREPDGHPFDEAAEFPTRLGIASAWVNYQDDGLVAWVWFDWVPEMALLGLEDPSDWGALETERDMEVAWRMIESIL